MFLGGCILCLTGNGFGITIGVIFIAWAFIRST